METQNSSPKSSPSTFQPENFDTLANGMAHAIRNPLSCILTAASLVAEDPNVADETKMLLDVIVKESKHLNNIFSDFLDYLRPSTSEPQSFDLGALAQRIAEQMQQSGQIGETEFHLESPLVVRADEQRLENAICQIFINSAQAASAGDTESQSHGKLRVSGEAQNGRIVLRIEDNGPGFSSRQLERAFDPFFSDTPDGTGLGLTIARAAIESAGGTLLLENRENASGARAILEVPQANDSESLTSESPVENDP
ncbi:MAG TPA: HAMP domain-containing sensor histidine kinase [Abditibacteriaceae bacterium]|jgi:signal transduction histidine kinase